MREPMVVDLVTALENQSRNPMNESLKNKLLSVKLQSVESVFGHECAEEMVDDSQIQRALNDLTDKVIAYTNSQNGRFF